MGTAGRFGAGEALAALGVLLAYALATLLSLQLVIETSGVSLVWLPAGVAFGTLWRLGWKRWPLVALADLLAQAAIGNPLGFLPFTAVANTLGAVVAVRLARHLSDAGRQTYSVRTAAVLSASGLTLGLVSAPLGVLGLVLNGMLPATAVLQGLLAWVAADAFGLLLVAPAVILAWTALARGRSLSGPRTRRGEKRAWCGLAGLTLFLVFFAGGPIAERYPMSLTAAPLALLLWSAVRFPPLFSAVATLLGGLSLAFLLVAGIGPVGAPQTTIQAAGVLMFLSVLVVTPLMLAAYSGDRQRALEALATANAELESRVAERTAELQGVLDELRATQANLVRQETLAGLGGLVAGVAHELNTPLDVVVTVASRGREKANALIEELDRPRPHRSLLSEGARELQQGFELVLGSGQRAAQLISTFKQVAADQHSQQRRRCNPGQLVRDAMLTLEPARRAQLEVELAVEDCEIESYPGALFSVLQQLVSNAALHAYPEGRGPLRIEVAPSASGGAMLAVIDRGVGVPAALAERIFHPFVTSRRGRGGTGLGLHLVHNVVTGLLGGEVQLRSEEGGGCTVRILLPAIAPAPAGAAGE